MKVGERYSESYLVEFGYVPWWEVRAIRTRVHLLSGRSGVASPQAFGRAGKKPRPSQFWILRLMASAFVLTTSLLVCWR